MDDREKLKQARTNLIERVADLTKQGMDEEDLETLKEMLASIERMDELIIKR